MFAVQNGNQVEYTRDGTFGISLVGNQAYLTTQDGCYVLDQNGDRIAIPKKQGTDDYDYGALKEQVGMFRFDYPSALSPISNNRYLPTEQSGNAEKAGLATSKLMQGFVENSGTNMMDEMTQMIAAQRAFQMSGRVVQTADEIEQIVNNLRK